jgi:hypothetical protein
VIHYRGVVLSLLTGCALLWIAATVHADTAPSAQLHEKYKSFQPHLENSVFGEPIHLESRVTDRRVEGDVFSIMPATADNMLTLLESPRELCNVLSLHTNIKGCIVRRDGGRVELAVYLGRKYYQPAESVSKIQYSMNSRALADGYVAVSLTAPDAPFGVHDQSIVIEAVPVAPDKLFLHMGYHYGYGMLGRLAMEGYFMTLGRGKVGFSKVKTTPDGEPVYIDGMQGLVERNTMRYFLALKTCLETLSLSDREDRFSTRLERWYDLTGEYKRQLYELPKAEYIAMKKRERAHQERLRHESGSL